MLQTFRNRLKYAAAVPVMAAGSAFAAVPADVTTAISDGKADALTVAGLILGLVIAVAIFRHMRGAK